MLYSTLHLTEVELFSRLPYSSHTSQNDFYKQIHTDRIQLCTHTNTRSQTNVLPYRKRVELKAASGLISYSVYESNSTQRTHTNSLGNMTNCMNISHTHRQRDGHIRKQNERKSEIRNKEPKCKMAENLLCVKPNKDGDDCHQLRAEMYSPTL